MRRVLILLALPLITPAEQARYGCLPAPEVTAAISRVEDLRGRAAPDEFRQEARQMMGVAVREHPDDVFVNLAYLFFYREKGHDDIIAAYRSAMHQHEADSRYALFYAASLIGSNTPEALQRLTALASPGFPYPYLLISQIHSYPKFKDSSALSTNLINFVKACPSYLPAYELLAYGGSGEELRVVAEQLREILKGRSDREALKAYRWLWAIEFRVAQPATHPGLRHQIEQDIEALGLTKRLDDANAVATLREGYRIGGNDGALKSLPPSASRLDPIYETEQQWRKEHPYPGPNASEEEVRKYHRASAEVARAWMEQWPNEPLPYRQRFRALSQLADTTERDLVAAGQQLIAINRKRPGRFLLTPAVIEVARIYVKRGIAMDSVPAMIDAGLDEAEAGAHVPEYDFFDDRNHRLNLEARFQARIEARSVQFDWSVKTSHLKSAHQALAEMRKDVDGLIAVTTWKQPAQSLDFDYWTKMTQLAELESRPQDAAEYRRAANNARNAPARLEDVPESARAIGKQLPPFRATGLNGRVWTAADLTGKIAVLGIWATWCGPCIAELPHFEKLYDMLKNKSNVVVVSLNIDANPGVVAPFLEERGFTFPVLLAQEYVNQVLPEISIPRTWIVESGVVRAEDVGFDEPDAWVKRILAKVEDVQPRP